MSLWWPSSRAHTSFSPAKASGKSWAIAAIGSGVRTPATTSSPWALTRNSPYRAFSPLAGSRVNATPVAEVSPRLPNTIAWTVTPVPIAAEMPCIRR